MDWLQVMTIVGVNAALIATMATMVIWAVNKLDGDIKSLSNRLDGISNRLDGHAQRIDQVYGIILQMLKERK